MAKEEYRDLLLKDLCARLPYGVCYEHFTQDDECIAAQIHSIDSDGYVRNYYDDQIINIYNVRPYLLPLSSMTEEQKEDLLLTVVGEEGLKLFSVTEDGIISKDKEEQSIENFCFNNIIFSNETTEAYINWLDKNMFDRRGLIPMGLAIDATGLNIY